MTIILGIESTAHTFGVGIVKNGKIFSNVKDTYTTESGGIIPLESAKHHAKVAEQVLEKAIEESKIKLEDIDAVAFSQGPGLAPCLLEGMKFAKELVKRLNGLESFQSRSHIDVTTKSALPDFSAENKVNLNNSRELSSILNKIRAKRDKSGSRVILLIPVNHCISHLEIGRTTGAKDPVMLYVSGANTQIIAYEAGKYRIFGETLDIGVGNFIDNFARFLGIGFPGGPKIEELAKAGKNYVELPYTVKGMDIALSGILTNLRQKVDKMKINNRVSSSRPPARNLRSFKTRELIASKSTLSDFSAENNVNPNKFIMSNNKSTPKYLDSTDKNTNKNVKDIVKCDYLNKKSRASDSELINYNISDLCYSMQEIVFAMLIETAERALAHTGKKELLLGGGVACNSRLQEMCKIMCKERGAKLFVPSRSLLVDNGAMIAFTGEIMFKSGIGFSGKQIEKVDILPRQRTDDVSVGWR